MPSFRLWSALTGQIVHARRVVAVVAAQHREVPPHRGERALLDVLHPRPEVPDRHLVLGLARDRAGVAADAAVVVDQEAVLHALLRRGSTCPDLRLARAR